MMDYDETRFCPIDKCVIFQTVCTVVIYLILVSRPFGRPLLEFRLRKLILILLNHEFYLKTVKILAVSNYKYQYILFLNCSGVYKLPGVYIKYIAKPQ